MDKMDVFLRRVRATLRTPNWSTLKRYGSNRVLRSSYYWILFVPVAARALRNVSGQHDVSVLGLQFTIELILPFSWQMFYWSAVCIGIATLIYSVRCPELIRQYASFADFSGPGRGQRQLFDMLRELLKRARVWRSNSWPIPSQRWLRHFLVLGARGDRTRADSEMTIVRREGQLNERVLDQVKIVPAEDVLTQAFWAARGMADWSRFWTRTLCAAFYLLGFLLFVIVVLQNAVYVYSWGTRSLWIPLLD